MGKEEREGPRGLADLTCQIDTVTVARLMKGALLEEKFLLILYL